MSENASSNRYCPDPDFCPPEHITSKSLSEQHAHGEEQTVKRLKQGTETSKKFKNQRRGGFWPYFGSETSFEEEKKPTERAIGPSEHSKSTLSSRHPNSKIGPTLQTEHVSVTIGDKTTQIITPFKHRNEENLRLKFPPIARKNVQAMDALVEEPAPLNIRKVRIAPRISRPNVRPSTLDIVRKLRADTEDKKSVSLQDMFLEPPNRLLESPTSYITAQGGPDKQDKGHETRRPSGESSFCSSNTSMYDQIDLLSSAVADLRVFQQLPPSRMRPRSYSQVSAVLEPLDFVVIENASTAEKKKGPDNEAMNEVMWGTEGRTSRESVTTSPFEGVERMEAPSRSSVEHEGSKRKWYRGFRR